MSIYRDDGEKSGCGREDGPSLLVLAVAADCNLRCRYCYAGGGDEKTHMSWPVARRAVDLMVEHSDRFNVQFTGSAGVIRSSRGY